MRWSTIFATGVALALASTDPTAQELAALGEDDACAASQPGDEGCALHALQFRAQKAEASRPKKSMTKTAVSGADDDDDDKKEKKPTEPPPEVVIYNCDPTKDAPCPEGMQCVEDPENKLWAQCVDCSTKAWRRDCVKFTDELRHAAIKVCGQTCPDSRCFDETWCPGSYKCAVTEDESWGQCVLCTKAYWKDHCAGWPDALGIAATKACRMSCEARQYQRHLTHHNH